MLKRVLCLASGLGLLLMVQSRGALEDSSRPSGRVGVAYWLPLRCEQMVTEFSPPQPDLNELDPDSQIIGGVAALRTSESTGYASQTAAQGRYEDPTLRLAAKTPLFVRRGSVFELRVPESFHDRVAIGWGSIPTHRLAVGPCESDTEWLFFPGGVWVADPECVTLEIVLQDSTVETFQLGIGAPCPGQQPPQGYSAT